ncbi:MAG: hypothetical protein HY327_07155 [Chloroflexi bacterium]|nr:hypothetical protein [Chloroflexota bacterium]
MKPKVTPYELKDPELLALVSPEMDRWLNSWTPEEHARYGGQYVAVSREKRVVAADKSGTRLQRKLVKLGKPKVAVFYMEPPDAYIIYSV